MAVGRAWSTERAPYFFKTSVWGRRAIDVEREHGIIVALSEPERGAVSLGVGGMGPVVRSNVLIDSRDGRTLCVAMHGGRMRPRWQWRVAAGETLLGLFDDDPERSGTCIGPRR